MSEHGGGLEQAASALVDRYSGIICDLDGVVYAGLAALPHAVEALEDALARGVGIVYATNNGSRPPEDVGAHLEELGLSIHGESVVTSAQAAAARLLAELGAGAPVLAVGGPGVSLALERAGLRAVTTAESAAGEAVRGVLQSFGASVSWSDLAEISYVVNGGALWVASNADLTLPTARGVAPGNGSLLQVVRAAVGGEPVVVGKPETALFELGAAVLDTSMEATLTIGDRIDTDIVGAARAGMDALLVFTGISTVADVVVIAPEHRPRYVAWDLRALTEQYVEPHVTTDAGTVIATCEDARATATRGDVRLGDGGSPGARLRAVVAAAWASADAGDPPDAGAVEGSLVASGAAAVRSCDDVGAPGATDR